MTSEELMAHVKQPRCTLSKAEYGPVDLNRACGRLPKIDEPKLSELVTTAAVDRSQNIGLKSVFLQSYKALAGPGRDDRGDHRHGGSDRGPSV